jgi:type IV pilus biogenesis protein CpaD/CtpE
MSRSSVFATLAALLLAGCANEAADLGSPTPISLDTVAREVVVPLYAFRSVESRNGWLRQEVGAIADGNIQAVRAEIIAREAGEADALRRTLVGLGLDPARITTFGGRTPRRASVVVLSRTVAGPADCKNSIVRAFPDDPLPSLMSLASCTQTNDLAAMLVDPADLVAPPALRPADGAYLVDGMRAWRTDRQGSLSGSGTTGSADAGSIGSSAPSSSTAAAVAPMTATIAAAPAVTAIGVAPTP